MFDQNLFKSRVSMFKSMTAYGRASFATPLGRFSAELQSVNRKHLEINTFLPKELLRYDTDIKKWIAVVVGRGQVNVKISVAFDRESPIVVTPNLPLARQIKSAWDAIGRDLKIPVESNQLINALMQTDDLLIYQEDEHDEEAYRNALKESIDLALKPFLAMKNFEGEVLQKDIVRRFEKLAKIIQEIALKAPGATERYRQRLMDRLNEIMGAPLEDERILKEVGIYAERIDIAEELTRFQSHLQQVGKLVRGESGLEHGVGKPLEFLVQELNREVNTMGSKSADADVSRCVVDIKTELERIREQIQNIE